jgi:Metal-sensitive transcriptional repressor
MSHIDKEKQKLVARIKRIRGQVDSIERSLTEEDDCADVLMLLAMESPLIKMPILAPFSPQFLGQSGFLLPINTLAGMKAIEGGQLTRSSVLID